MAGTSLLSCPPHTIDGLNFWGYKNYMFTWDEGKRAANLAKHGVDFIAAENFDFGSALVVVDRREDYRELREIALGFIGMRLHVMVFTRRGDGLRIISLRKANKREERYYEQQKA